MEPKHALSSWERRKPLAYPVLLVVPFTLEASGVISPEWAPFWWTAFAVALFALWRSDDLLDLPRDYGSAVGAAAFGLYTLVIVLSLSTVTIETLDKRVHALLDTNNVNILFTARGGAPGNTLSYYITMRGHDNRPITVGIPRSDWEVLTIWSPMLLPPEHTEWLDGMTDAERRMFADDFQISMNMPHFQIELRPLPPSSDKQSGRKHLLGISTSLPLSSEQVTVINEIANVGRASLRAEALMRRLYQFRR